MRKWALVLVAAVLTLALAGVAVATSQFKQVANITFTADKAGQSTGIKADVHSTDPGALGQKPKAATQLVVTFPAGTKFNFGKVHPCTLSDKQLTQTNSTGCPASSKVGSGTAVANVKPTPLGLINAKVTAFARNSKTVILWVTSKVATPQVIILSVSGTSFSIPVPVQKLGSVPIVLTSLKLNIPASGSGRSALITAGKCVAKQFVVKTRFTYVDHTSLDVTSTSACS